MSEKKYVIILTEAGLAFAQELVRSKLAITIDNVEHVAEFKKAILDVTEHASAGVNESEGR